MALFDIFSNDDYNPSTIGEELFLSEVPQNLKLDAIKKQFSDPFNEMSVDYIQSWIKDYNCSVDEVVTDDEERSMEETVTRFIETMLNYFREYFNIGFPDFDRESEGDQIEILHIVYRYFIINIKKNFNSLIMNEINNNQLKLVENLTISNDVVTQSVPDTVPNEIKLIISNLDTVVHTILEKDWDGIDEFVNSTWSDKTSMETDFVIKLIDEDRLTGNFIDRYVSTLNIKDKTSIISKTRKKLLKRYSVRAMENSDE